MSAYLAKFGDWGRFGGLRLTVRSLKVDISRASLPYLPSGLTCTRYSVQESQTLS